MIWLSRVFQYALRVGSQKPMLEYLEIITRIDPKEKLYF